MEAYLNAKLRIFENQTSDDFAVLNFSEIEMITEALEARKRPLQPTVISFSAVKPGADFELKEGVICFRGTPVLAMDKTKLRGVHNAENLMSALAVGYLMGLSFETMAPALSTYKSLPHRCELVATVHGIDYINDSKATNIDALEKALLSETRPVVLIAGGKDKGFEYASITDLITSKVHHVVLIGEMAPRIAAIWESRVPCEQAANLEDAVHRARGHARSGDVVLFSPAHLLRHVRNYADRGDQSAN